MKITQPFLINPRNKNKLDKVISTGSNNIITNKTKMHSHHPKLFQSQISMSNKSKKRIKTFKTHNAECEICRQEYG